MMSPIEHERARQRAKSKRYRARKLKADPSTYRDQERLRIAALRVAKKLVTEKRLKNKPINIDLAGVFNAEPE